jgi:hypothetical protein
MVMCSAFRFSDLKIWNFSPGTYDSIVVFVVIDGNRVVNNIAYLVEKGISLVLFLLAGILKVFNFLFLSELLLNKVLASVSLVFLLSFTNRLLKNVQILKSILVVELSCLS